MLTYFCILSFGAGIGILVLHSQGDVFSQVIVLLTLFGTPFFVSGFRNQIDKETFIRDSIIGVSAACVNGLVLLLSSYQGMATVAAFSIFIILILKLVKDRTRR